MQHASIVRRIEREGRNGDLEALPVLGDHAIFADHHAARGRQRAARGVAESFAGPDGRLFADHAGAAHLLLAPLGVGDAPMALEERDRLVAEIGDLDVVTPEVAALVRIGTVRLEGRLDEGLLSM